MNHFDKHTMPVSAMRTIPFEPDFLPVDRSNYSGEVTMKRLISGLLLALCCVAISGCADPEQRLEELGAAIVYHPDGQIKEINLRDSDVTDTDLAALRGLENCWMVNLHHTRITDAGLKHLSSLNELRGLNLALTHVSDSGLAYLENMKHLEGLVLDHTDVTPDGVIYLQTKLPTTNIMFTNEYGETVSTRAPSSGNPNQGIRINVGS
jgi:hypothetical protein